ncbi:MAG: proline--tRNA ligase, partial [Deltaproteobacteria bacterium]|nr:proline--tRNA ligase [Deltaproteobacteria bacterium]
MAMPVIKGRKSPLERFPGAVDTLCIEAMMQDRKALQSGTSHFLGQNFARSSNIKFQSADEKEMYAWTTSWGVSTRLIGGLIMIHGDDDGLILPPRIASSHVVLMPIIRKPEDREKVMTYVNSLAEELKDVPYHSGRVEVEIDDRDIGGTRGWDWIKKGIPVRVEIGLRDIGDNSVFMARRDKSLKEKVSIKKDIFVKEIPGMLDEMQRNLFDRASAFTEKHTISIDDRDKFIDFFTPENIEKSEIHGGFALSHWCGADECELKIKDDLSVTIRCIPFDSEKDNGHCVCCGKKSDQRVIFAKAY